MPTTPIIIQGRLLRDPDFPPQLGWIVVEDRRIAEVCYGDLPTDLAPPTFGGRDRLITPAFTDLHFHFPQIDSVGCDGLELLNWLDGVIFPAEAWWGRGGAPSMTRAAVRRLTREGTVGVAGYLSSHAAINHEVTEFLQNSTPLRFHVGRVAMDRNAPEELIAEDRERARRSPTPSPLLPQLRTSPGEQASRHGISANPRFAISCTEELLAEMGWLARKSPEIFVQTHLAETLPECELIRRLFPDDASYTAVYDRFGLLHERTILAHCLHLGPDEWRCIAGRNAIIAHCPAANTFLQAGLFDLDTARKHDIRVGLGTDVAAGPDIAMPRVARSMIEVAKVRRMTRASRTSEVDVPTPAEAWRMITESNADLLGWTDAGRIEPGAQADLLVLRTPPSWFDEHLVGRLIYSWDSLLIEHRIFNGEPFDPNTM